MNRRFSLRDLLMSVAFIAAAAACLKYSFGRIFDDPSWQKVLLTIQFLAVGPLLGIGILTPFHKKKLGAYLGFFGGIIGGFLIQLAYHLGWLVRIRG